MAKKCSRCGEYKDIIEFKKYSSMCKNCRKEYKRENYIKNRESILIKQKIYREENKDEINKKRRKEYSQNREKFLERSKFYGSIRKEEIKLYNKKYYIENLEKFILNAAKKRACNKKLSFNIDDKFIKKLLINTKVCPLLGIDLIISGTINTDNSPTLDRIYSNGGYEEDNLHIVSNKANRSKNNATIEEYELIANNLKKLIDVGVEEHKELNINVDNLYWDICKRSKKNNWFTDIDRRYLKKIYPLNNKCPLLGIKLQRNIKIANHNSPSLDRINGGLYIKGNVAFMSFKANTIKNNLNIDEMITLLNNWKNIINRRI